MPPVSRFPSVSVNDALAIARVIATTNAGRPMRRLDVFDSLERAPDSGPSRTLITASSSYGLTSGGYKTETLSLAPIGKRIAVDGIEAALVDAVLSVPVFKAFFEHHVSSQFPAATPANSFLAEQDVPTGRVEACLQVLRESGEQARLILERSGAARVVSAAAARESWGDAEPDGDRAPTLIAPTRRSQKTCQRARGGRVHFPRSM